LPPFGAVLADAHHTPLIDQHRGRDTEGDHVRETVVFLAEGALGAGPACDSAVQPVEEQRDEYRRAGECEVRVNGGDDGIETGEQAPRGQQIGQQINAAFGLSLLSRSV